MPSCLASALVDTLQCGSELALTHPTAQTTPGILTGHTLPRSVAHETLSRPRSWQDPGKIPARSRRGPGKILPRSRRDTGEILARYWRGPGEILTRLIRITAVKECGTSIVAHAAPSGLHFCRFHCKWPCTFLPDPASTCPMRDSSLAAAESTSAGLGFVPPSLWSPWVPLTPRGIDALLARGRVWALEGSS